MLHLIGALQEKKWGCPSPYKKTLKPPHPTPQKTQTNTKKQKTEPAQENSQPHVAELNSLENTQKCQ